MMFSKKRKSHFNDSLKFEFPSIRSVNNEKTMVNCTLCNSTFSVASGGRNSINLHMQSRKHKNAAATKLHSKSVVNCYNAEPSKAKYDVTSNEVVEYHKAQGEDQILGMVFQEPFVELHTECPENTKKGGDTQVVQLLKQHAEDRMLLKDSLTRVEALLKHQKKQPYDTSLRRGESQPAFIDSSCHEENHSSDTSTSQASFYAVSYPTPASSWNYDNHNTDNEAYHRYNDNSCNDPGGPSSAQKDDSQGPVEETELLPSFQEPIVKLEIDSPPTRTAVEESQVLQLLKQHSEGQMRLQESLTRVEDLLAEQVTLSQQMLVLSSKRHATEERLVSLLEENRLMLVPKSS